MRTKNGWHTLYLSIVFFLNGCGQMGPLYLPDQKPPVYIPHHFAKSSS
ncbi:MAG: lipoprotein [Candidatus Aquirickettsiella sp.]